MLMMMELPETAGAGAGTERLHSTKEMFVMMHVCRHGQLHGHGDEGQAALYSSTRRYSAGLAAEAVLVRLRGRTVAGVSAGAREQAGAGSGERDEAGRGLVEAASIARAFGLRFGRCGWG